MNDLDDIFSSVGEAVRRSTFTPSTGGGGQSNGLSAIRQRLSARTPGRGAPSVMSAYAGSPQAHANGDVRKMVQDMAAKRGWTGGEWNALADLIQRESGWKPNAKNPTSSAAGLFQFLDSTRKNYGITMNSPLQAQIDAGLRYVQDRYKTPSGALSHWLARKPINGRDVGNWY